jgi:hypothetical protein
VTKKGDCESPFFVIPAKAGIHGKPHCLSDAPKKKRGRQLLPPPALVYVVATVS